MFWYVVVFFNVTPKYFFGSIGFAITTTVLPALFSKHKVIAVVILQSEKETQMKIPKIRLEKNKQVFLGDKCIRI